MYYRQKFNFFAAFLVCTAATLAASFPQQRSAPRPRHRRGHDPDGEHLTGPQASQRPSRSWFRHLDKLSHMDEKMTETSTDAASGEKTPGKATESSKEWVYVTASPPAVGCLSGDVELARAGRFFVSGRLEVYTPTGDYQRDPGDPGQFRVKGQILRDSEKVWERLQPVVKCRRDSMALTVRNQGVEQLLLHPVNDSSVPLSQLPPQCGYSVQTTWRDLSLTARYSACHVTLEGDNYVLPLLWRGTPVKVSCPASQVEPQSANPPALCCAPYGVTVKLHKVSAEEDLRLNVRGEWTPLMTVAEQCGYTIERRDADVVVTAPFITCGITVQDGKYSFSLQVGDDIFTLACPVTPLDNHSLLESPSGGGDERSSNPPPVFPWTPPFYLAPPHYPHPVYHHEGLSETTCTSSARQHAVAHSSRDSSWTEDQTYVSNQVPSAERQACAGVHSPSAPQTRMEDFIPLHPDPHQRPDFPTSAFPEGQRAARFFPSDTDVPVQVDVPPLQPSSQYYHYYHNPKIPLSDPPRDPNAAVEPFPQVDQGSGGPAGPFQYQYLPEDLYGERDDAKRFALYISETIPKPQFPVLPGNFRFSSLPTSRTHGSEFSHSLPSEENRLRIVRDEPPLVPNLSPMYTLPQQPQYYLLYYPYQHMYQPRSFVATDSRHLTPSRDPLKPSSRSSPDLSFEKSQTATVDHLPHFHHYDVLKASKDKQEVQPTGAANSNAKSSHSSSSGVQRRAAGSGSNRRPDSREEPEVNGESLEEKSGWQFFAMPDFVQEATAPGGPPEASNVSCMLNSDPNIFLIPLLGCGRGQYAAVRLLEEPDVKSLHVVGSVSENSVRLISDCSSTGSPEEVSLPATTPTRPPSSAEAATVQLRIATDESFSSFHPETPLPLSLLQERPVYLQVVLAEPQDPDLVLLVLSCIAYTHSHWMSVYESCSSGGESWLLPSAHSDHIQRIVLSGFLSPPSDDAATVTKGGHAHPEDPEIFFLCLTEVCSTAAGECEQSCNNNPVTVMWSMK